MNKVLKIRKVVLFSTLAVVGIGIILSILSMMLKRDFVHEINAAIDLADQQTPKQPLAFLSKVNDNSSSMTIIFMLITPWIFYIFALIYIFRKGNFKVQGRKWPYIVMIVFGAISIIMNLAGLAMFANSETGLLTIKQDSMDDANFALVKKAIGAIWDTHESRYRLLIIVHVIATVVILGLNITQLVLIKKAKNNADMDYSEQIRNFQAKNNDLP